jgi:hypothetical protein
MVALPIALSYILSIAQNSVSGSVGPPVRLKNYLERLENEGVARVKVNTLY